jgi:hypothetical protein
MNRAFSRGVVVALAFLEIPDEERETARRLAAGNCGACVISWGVLDYHPAHDWPDRYPASSRHGRGALDSC